VKIKDILKEAPALQLNKPLVEKGSNYPKISSKASLLLSLPWNASVEELRRAKTQTPEEPDYVFTLLVTTCENHHKCTFKPNTTERLQ